MYRTDTQITIEVFSSPFGTLNVENRWVKMANLIPWERYEARYAEQFCDNNGSPAVPFRMALGTLMIKQQTNQSDQDVYQSIQENPYMQFLIGLHSFTEKLPFSLRSITNFRQYISQELMSEINADLFAPPTKSDEKDGDGTGGGASPASPHTVPNRIVSISQPHVRPIVRGKAKAAVEFGAKVSIHMVDGYAFVDYIGWDAYKVEYLREVRVSIQPMKRVC